MVLRAVFGMVNIIQDRFKSFEVTEHEQKPALMFTKDNKHFVLTDNAKIFRLTDKGDGQPIEMATRRQELHKVIMNAKNTISANEDKFPGLAAKVQDITNAKIALKQRQKRKLSA